MVGVLQKYRTVLIILALAALIAIVILLITLTNKRTEKIPLRGIFVENVELIKVKEETV